jgi:oligoendopeptidase F
MAPWDLYAPAPSFVAIKPISFPEAIEIIAHSFKSLSPDMADFAKMMKDKRWIDSATSPNRAQGAYCGGFTSTREPRVFMTYDGTMKNVLTLAHELGHAYHNWVMRDLKLTESFYSMTLAETASIFAETLVRDTLLQNAKTAQEKKQILWQDIQSASTFLLDIPSRFEFEKRMIELKKIKTVTVQEMKNLMKDSMAHWYGDTLSEYNEMFWASKLHFSIPSFGFYNYPYLFGYLFSLGIYAKKDQYGQEFANKYKNILCDTGIMTAEDLIKKHFNEDITKNDFWRKSLGIVNKSVETFKKV